MPYTDQHPTLIEALDDANITQPEEQALFLAQINGPDDADKLIHILRALKNAKLTFPEHQDIYLDAVEEMPHLEETG